MAKVQKISKAANAELMRLGEVIPEGPKLNEIRACIANVRQEIKNIETSRRTNDLSDLVNSLGDQFSGVYGSYGYSMQPRMQPYTLAGASNFAQITLDRLMLTEAYTSQQYFAILIDLVPDEAHNGKITFKCKGDELSDDDLELLQKEMYRARLGIRGGTTNIMESQIQGVRPQLITDSGPSYIECIKFARKMTRLYGGGALIINTDQDYRIPFDISKLRKDSPLDFMPCDRWEVSLMSTNLYGFDHTPFNYYGVPVDRTRVVTFKGKEAPALVRQRLQGWGLSELEACIGAVNAMIKFENVMFELLDQAKIDVYRLDGFSGVLGTATGVQQAHQRVHLANALKNYARAIIMDKNDEYEQKKFQFAGLAEIWNELRRNLAAQMKIPMNKLFGESAGGFGSGDDSQQNFISILQQERTVQEPCVMFVAEVLCQSLFGYVPKTLYCEWPELRSLDGVQEEQVLTARQDRAIERFQMGLTDAQETMQSLFKDKVFTMKTAALSGKVDIESPMVAQISMKEKSLSAPGRTGEGDQREKKRDTAKDRRENSMEARLHALEMKVKSTPAPSE